MVCVEGGLGYFVVALLQASSCFVDVECSSIVVQSGNVHYRGGKLLFLKFGERLCSHVKNFVCPMKFPRLRVSSTRQHGETIDRRL